MAVLRLLVGARVRSEWQYRTSFITHLLSQTMVHVLEVVSILILLDVVPSLGGWDRSQALLLFAMGSLPMAFSGLGFASLDAVSRYVKSGEFDRVLLRPTPALLQLVGLEFALRRIGKVIPDVITLVIAVAFLDLEWSVPKSLYLALSVGSATVMYSSLFVLASSFAFWTVDGTEATNAFTYGSRFANQHPLHLYPSWLRAISGFVIPVGFAAYAPAIYLADAPNPLGLPTWLGLLSPVVAALMVVVSLSVWGVGIRRYQSTGS